MTTATENTVNNRVKQYEGYLASYIANGSKESLEEVAHRFTGDYWLKVNIPSIESANLDPYALKEAYLKACDFFGVERPSVNSLQETEVTDRKDFWNTELNPVTMTKVESYAFAEIADDTFIDYDYAF